MTGEHDYDTTVQPFVCRRCRRSIESIRGDFFPELCSPAPPQSGADVEVGGISAPSRHRLVDAESDGSIARRLDEIKALEGRA